MTGLTVGQRWTTPVVSPLATTDSIQLVESRVERQETITWQGEETETFLVVYRYDSGRGAAARDPVGKAWVRTDGTIVRQELPLGSARIRFERTTEARANELAGVLESRNFDRLLHRRVSGMESETNR